MSVDAVVSRVAQLQQLMAATAAPASTDFAAALAGAGQSPATAATALTTGVAGAGSTATALATAMTGALGTAGTGALGSTATGALGTVATGALGTAGTDALGTAGTGALGTAASGAAPGTAAAVGSATAGSSLPAGTPYAAQIMAAARRHGIDPALLAGLIKQESGFNPRAGSPAGAQGLTQLMPGTARGLGVTNPLDPVQSIEGGAKYLRQQLDTFGGDVARALAAYNAGPGAVQRFGGVPPYAETQNYVRQVQAYAASFRTSSSSTI